MSRRRKGPRPAPFTYDNLLSAQDYRCFYCARKMHNVSDYQKAKAMGVLSWTRDHFFSICSGNECHLGNMVLACRDCNSYKGHRDPTRAECIRFYVLWRRARQLHNLKLSEAWEDFMSMQFFIVAFSWLFGEHVIAGQVATDVDFLL